MKCSALNGRLLCKAKQMDRFIRQWIVQSGVSTIPHETWVDRFDRHLCSLNLQSAAMRASTFAMLIAIASPAPAIAQHTPGGNTELTEDLAKGSPELMGDQWGWRLTRYKEFQASFKINGRTLVMLSTDLQLTDDVIWDPLTGLGRYLDHDQSIKFIEAHRQDMFDGIYSPGQGTVISGDRTIEAWPAPGVGNPSCTPNFYEYFNVYDSSHRLLRSFYVVEKLADPQSIKYHICNEGSRGHVDTTPKVTIEFDTGLTTIHSLSDRTLLFTNTDKYGTTIVRLDKNQQQLTSVGGLVFVLDAAGINSELEPAGEIQDPTFRYNIFFKAIETAKDTGLH
jgi:hypothetical protein